MVEKELRNKVICFTTTKSQFDRLKQLAPSRDSLSQLLREIISEYLASAQTDQPSTQQ